MKTLKERIEIMQACLDGKEIEYISTTRYGGELWSKSSNHNFNWDVYDYRIKPEPMVLWINTEESDHICYGYRRIEDAERLATSPKKFRKFIEVIE